MVHIGLDFETASSVDLPKYGLDNYIKSPDFRVLTASIADSRRTATSLKFLGKSKSQIFDELHEQFSLAEQDYISYLQIAAHNAPFEMKVLEWLGFEFGPVQFIDTAVIARANGAGSALRVAAPQLIGLNKMDEGVDLIKKFSIPREDGTFVVDEYQSWDDSTWDEWELFGHYCDTDAMRSFHIAEEYRLSSRERRCTATTHKMNEEGWYVDLGLVKMMKRNYLENLDEIVAQFYIRNDMTDLDEKERLNFNSPVQLARYCADRGMKVSSLDEQNLARYLRLVTSRINSDKFASLDQKKRSGLLDIRDMLETKKELGGSSLKKLEVIERLVSDDGRLRGQYLHIGAGQSYRTSGRGVQMQNLKRLNGEGDDVEDFMHQFSMGDTRVWNNDKLARNIRQVFRAEADDGALIVGDFASVESRGLAFLAGAEWKLDAFRNNKDMYKVLASKMLGVHYDDVSKTQRMTGKVGELSCGYGAGPQAVADFAAKMGVDFDMDQATKTVVDWRGTNPEVVSLWGKLDEALRKVATKQQSTARIKLAHGLTLVFEHTTTPMSLSLQFPGAQTIEMRLVGAGDSSSFTMSRVFQGVHLKGSDICYIKPSELKNGALWTDKWTKGKLSGNYKLYGGKLAGILTQSFCRELFFYSLRAIENQLETVENVKLIGQFHDEIVLEWSPPTHSSTFTPTLPRMEQLLRECMSECHWFPDFPLAADVHSALRYIK